MLRNITQHYFLPVKKLFIRTKIIEKNMDKLHLFETAEEHYNTYLGSGYTEPWVGYDIESNDTTYNYGVL